MFSEFSTLDAYVSSDYYERRNDSAFVEKHFFKFVLFEFYTPMLCRMIARRQRHIPSSVFTRLPSFVLMSPSLSDQQIQKQIDAFWLKKAIHVLSGYQQVKVPFSADPSVPRKMINLLSSHGQNVLKLLQNAEQRGVYPDSLKQEAFRSANKFLLDLNLFISFPHIEEASFLSQKARLTVSLSTGCYNQCVHCAYEAKPPVSHMPYPIFLRLVEAFAHRLSEPASQMLYANSDPLSYYDPIIEADSADVVHFLKHTIPLQNRQKLAFLTKGILQKKDEKTVAKLAMGRHKITLSVLLLPGEPIHQNICRVLKTIDVYTQSGGERDQIEGRIFSADGRQGVPLLESKGIPFGRSKPCLTGRWVDTVQAYDLNSKAYLRNGFGDKNNLVIQADGSVWLNTLNPDTGRYDWKVLDDIYQYKSRRPIHRVLQTVQPIVKARIPSVTEIASWIGTIERVQE